MPHIPWHPHSSRDLLQSAPGVPWQLTKPAVPGPCWDCIQPWLCWDSSCPLGRESRVSATSSAGWLCFHGLWSPLRVPRGEALEAPQPAVLSQELWILSYKHL